MSHTTHMSHKTHAIYMARLAPLPRKLSWAGAGAAVSGEGLCCVCDP
jgi:hypothetical protein